MPGNSPSDEQVLPTDGFAAFPDEMDDEIGQEEQPITDEPSLKTDDTDIDFSDDDLSAKETEESVASAESESVDNQTVEASQEETLEESEEKELSKKDKFEQHSKRVQRRINKEVKMREQLKADNDALRQRLEALEQNINQTQMQEQRAKEQSDFDLLTSRIRNATSIKEKLLEEGDYAEVAKVDNDIMQMKIYQSRLEEHLQQSPVTTQQQPQHSPVPPQQGAQTYDPYYQGQQPQAPQQIEIPDIQRTWITNNERYGKDAAYSQYVDATYDQLIEEGFDPEDESLYEELNQRTNSQVSFAAKQSVQQNKPKPRRQAAPAPNTGSAQVASTKRRTGLTEADKQNMRNWGLDPNDEHVRKEWLRNKQRVS